MHTRHPKISNAKDQHCQFAVRPGEKSYRAGTSREMFSERTKQERENRKESAAYRIASFCGECGWTESKNEYISKNVYMYTLRLAKHVYMYT